MGLLLRSKTLGLRHLEVETEQEKMDLKRAGLVIGLKID